MKNHCAARLLWSTLAEAERRIGLCGDATRAPHQLPKWLRAAAPGVVALPRQRFWPKQPFWPQSDKSSCRCPFKLHRGTIPQRRVQAFLVVHLIDKLGDGRLRLRHVPIVIAIHFLVLQGFDKALGKSVVVRIAGPAHAAADLVLVQQFAILGAGVLYAAIRMMHQSR